MSKIVLETGFMDWPPSHRGKVRDNYHPDDENMVIVTTDRISAYDVVMRQGVPHKGAVLHGITKYWMQHLGIANHYITDDLNEIGKPFSEDPETFRGRTMLVKRYTPFPIECIVRGYITGSAWQEYSKTGVVCGVKLPQYLNLNQAFAKPIFTPSTKAVEGHDENITCQQMEERLVEWLKFQDEEVDDAKSLAHHLSGWLHHDSVNVYEKIADMLWNKGIIAADTKLEWGVDLQDLIKRNSSAIYLIDEAGTPDSSRFWDFKDYRLGGNIRSLDKQSLRDWLDGRNWDRKSPPPDLSPELINHISQSYLEIYERIVGTKLEVEW